MIRLIFTIPLLLIVFLGDFKIGKSKDSNLNSDMTLCFSGEVDDFVTPNIERKTTGINNVFQNDSTKSYSMPLLSQTPNGNILLSWTEKNAQGIVSFCMAFSNDNGKTFTEKKTVYTGAGISNSRMMRAKVLAKKDGSFVAIFSNRADASSGGGRSRAADLVFCESKDGGDTWTTPKSVDSDKTKCMRGFFDAALMANDEVAVAYLKDVANSTKFEERNLRLVVTKNGEFLPERIIDSVVCDCCPVSLLLDANGALNVYYRDNNENIRDMATMKSTDNGQTFSSPKILNNDNWSINGCPHSGAISSTYGKSAMVAWYSGAESESGIRLVTQEGKKLFVLDNRSAKNAYLVENPKATVMLWEQSKGDKSPTEIAYRTVNKNTISETIWLEGSLNSSNASGLSIDNHILVAFETKQANRNSSIKLSTINL